MTALKRVFGNISALWNKSESCDIAGPGSSEKHATWGSKQTKVDPELFSDLGSNNLLEDRRKTGEDEFSVDYDLEEFLIKTSARQIGHHDFNYAKIKSTKNEYSYLCDPVPVDLDDDIYTFLDKDKLLFIDSKRICLANTLKQSIEQMFLKREIEKVSILSHTVAVRRQKSSSKCPADLMLLDLRRFENVASYLQLFYINLL